MLNASINKKRIIRVFRSSVRDQGFKGRRHMIYKGDHCSNELRRHHHTHTHIEREREREQRSLRREPTIEKSGHILSYIEWYHIIGMGDHGSNELRRHHHHEREGGRGIIGIGTIAQIIGIKRISNSSGHRHITDHKQYDMNNRS
jgi:hypothetical protein